MTAKESIHVIERHLGAELACENARVPALPSLMKKELESAEAPKVPARAIKKILVAVDHGHHPALALALSLAGPLHAQVAVIHVVEPVAITSMENPTVYAETLDCLRANGQALLKEIETELPLHARAFTCLREGPASDEIMDFAQEWPADLIVMGTRRRGAVVRMLLGSASAAVVHHGHCPVLLVEDSAADAPQPEPRKPA